MNAERRFRIIKNQFPDQVTGQSLEEYRQYTSSDLPLCLASTGAIVVTGIENDSSGQSVTVFCLACLAHGVEPEHRIQLSGDYMSDKQLEEIASVSLFSTCEFREEME